MQDLMKTEDREIRKGSSGRSSTKVLEYRNRISDESYMDEAIMKIATDLSHYLTK